MPRICEHFDSFISLSGAHTPKTDILAKNTIPVSAFCYVLTNFPTANQTQNTLAVVFSTQSTISLGKLNHNTLGWDRASKSQEDCNDWCSIIEVRNSNMYLPTTISVPLLLRQLIRCDVRGGITTREKAARPPPANRRHAHQRWNVFSFFVWFDFDADSAPLPNVN